MRRLPVYLLIDTSGSMIGEPIQAVNNGMQVLISSLRQDPNALESAYISVLTFDQTAKQVIPLTDLASFQSRDFSAQGGTSLGEGLKLLAQCIEREVAKSSLEVKGDWKPLVFIMTDGVPTDSWKLGLEEFKKVKVGILVACAVGGKADLTVLKEITENVVSLDTVDSSSIKAYFKWISSSISLGSQKIEASNKEIHDLKELPPPPPEINIIT